MFFNLRLLVVFLSLIFTALGCSRESEPVQKTYIVGTSNVNCLSNAGSKIERYFDGQSSEGEVRSFWQCARNSLETFQTYVKGQTEEEYFATDLRWWLEEYFLNEKQNLSTKKHISDDLLFRAMEIKQLFLGGTTDKLSKDEIRLTLELVGKWEKITLDLLPHAPSLFAPTDQAKSTDQESAGLAMESAIISFLEPLKQTGRTYDLQSVAELLVGLNDYFQQENEEFDFAKWVKYIDLISVGKQISMNSNSSAVSGTEWGALAQILGRVFRIVFLASDLEISNLLTEVASVKEAKNLRQLMVEPLEVVFSRRNNTPIRLEEIHRLLFEIHRVDLMPWNMPFEEASDFSDKVLNHILNPDNANPESGLSLGKVQYLFSEMDLFLDGQIFLLNKNHLFGVRMPFLQDLIDLFSTPFFLGHDLNSRLLLSRLNPGWNSPKWDVDSKTQLHWSYRIFDLLARVYIESEDRKPNKLMTEAELSLAINDVAPVLVGLDLMTKGDKKFASRIFRDGNHFVSRSNGDGFLSVFELSEFLHFVYGGISSRNFLIENLDSKCVVDDKVRASCYRSVMRKNEVIGNFESLVLYKNNITVKEWDRVVIDLEKLARDQTDSVSPLSRSELAQVFVGLQYVEISMLRFDKNSNGFLDIKEFFQVIDHFEGLLMRLLPEFEGNRPELEVFVTFLAKTGQLPDPNDPKMILKLNEWKLKRPQWELQVDRKGLIAILAAISAQ